MAAKTPLGPDDEQWVSLDQFRGMLKLRKPKLMKSDGKIHEWIEKRRMLILKGEVYDLSYKDQRKKYFWQKNRKNPRKQYY